MVCRTLSVLGALLISAITPAIAFAGDDLSTSSLAVEDFVIPYDGFLMEDSLPMDGDVDLTFFLYWDETGGESVWSEDQTVRVYNGRFSVGLGAATSIDATLLDAESLYLAIEVDETLLAGRQAIEPVPYAIWSAHATDLSVTGSITLTNPENAVVEVSGANNAILRLSADSDDDEAGVAQVYLDNGPDGADASFRIGTGHNLNIESSDNIYIDPDADSTGDDNEVTIQGDLNVDGNITVNGNNIRSDTGQLVLNNSDATNGVRIHDNLELDHDLVVLGRDIYTTTGRLVLNRYEGSAGVRMVGNVLVDDDLDVEGNLDVDGDLDVAGDLDVEGEIRLEEGLRLWLSDSAPFPCEDDDDVGYVYFDSDRPGGDDAPCYCRRGNGGTYKWVPVHNSDGLCE